MLPDLESLRCFVAGARQLNFRLAARTVALSPAAYGERIKRLEDLLGAPLFTRTTRRVTLTPAGERLLVKAQAALDAAARCVEAVADGAPVPFALTIGTRFELGLGWLTPALGPLERQRPERRLHLYFGDTEPLLDALDRGEIDALVTSARIGRPGLDYARLHEERYAFVASERLLGERPLARAAHARDHTLLELNRSLPLFRYFRDARPGRELWAFGHTQYLGTIGAVRLRVLDGAGVAVLPEYFIAGDLERGRLVPILPKVAMPHDWFRLVWTRGASREQEYRRLAEELSQHPLR